MNPLQLIRVVWARRSLAAKIVAAVMLLALAASLLLPKRYTATADVIIDLASPDPVAGTSVNNSPIALLGYVATQVDVIRSERVARKVVEKLRLREQPDLLERWREKAGDTEDFTVWTARELLKDLQVRPAREGNVVKVAFTARSPQRASDLANGFAQTYIDTALALRMDPATQNAEFFEQRVKLAQEQVEAARLKVTTFQRQNSITITDEKVDIETARLTDLSEQLVKVEGQLLENRSRGQANRGDGASSMAEVLESRLVQELKTQLSDVDKQLQNKSVTLGPAHPDIRSLNAERATLRAKLDAEVGRYANSVRQSEAVNSQRVVKLREAIAEQRDKVVRLKGLRDQLAVYQNELETAQKNYEAISQRQTQTGMESQNRLTNVSVLTPAVAPSEPSSPRLLLNLAIAGVAGLALAIAAALMIESKVPRVRHVDDLLDTIDLPVLTVVPTGRKSRTQGRLAQAMLTLDKA